MDRFITAARARGKGRDVVLFSLLRYSGMRRGSVVARRVRNIDGDWGLRDVPTKGERTQDIPLPPAVRRLLAEYVSNQLPTYVDVVTSETPLFWSSYGARRRGKVCTPMSGKNLWRICQHYSAIVGLCDGERIGPHAFRHGVAMEVYSKHADLEKVRALLGHASIQTTQTYARIKPKELQAAVSFYETQAAVVLETGETNARV